MLASRQVQLGRQHQEARRFFRHRCSGRVRGASVVVHAAATTSAPASVAAAEGLKAGPSFNFVCPVCLQQQFATMKAMPTRSTGLCCPRCNRTFTATPDYVDLTLTSGLQPKAGRYNQKEWGGTELFRNPLISFVYERGWRQGFSWAGFPGVDVEYDMAMEYLRPAHGKVLVDMSCGSGLFSRRFARSNKFSGVIAADFSESMLKQAKAFFQEDGSMPRAPTGSSVVPATTTLAPTPLMLLRADVGRLPFATGSVAAIHAGAAIHCWPNPQAAFAEISRVLAPGGVFVATTFLVAGAPLGEIIGDDVVRPLRGLDAAMTRNQYKWWEESELRDLCDSVGLQGFTRERKWRFIMFSATKPSVAALDSGEFDD